MAKKGKVTLTPVKELPPRQMPNPYDTAIDQFAASGNKFVMVEVEGLAVGTIVTGLKRQLQRRDLTKQYEASNRNGQAYLAKL